MRKKFAVFFFVSTSIFTATVALSAERWFCSEVVCTNVANNQDSDEYCIERTGYSTAECVVSDTRPTNSDSMSIDDEVSDNTECSGRCRYRVCDASNTCSNVWRQSSESHESQDCQIVSTNCDEETQTKYRCGANYYSATGTNVSYNISNLNCTKCPIKNGVQSTSPAGSISVNACVDNSSSSQTCTVSTTCNETWNNSGSFQNRKCVQTLANCSKKYSYEYRCAAGYYAANSQTGGVASSANNLKCTRCPKIDNVQSKSSAGGVGKGVCCINPGDTGEDESGPFVIESTCCAS